MLHPPMHKASIFLLTGMIFALVCPLQLWAADPAGTEHEPSGGPRSLRFHFQYGWPTRYFSQKLYSNFNTASLNLTYEKECPPVPFLAKFNLLESLLLEFRFLKIWGNNIPLYHDQVSPARLAEFNAAGREPTTNWDTYQIGLTPYYRLYYPLTKSFRPYFELGVGLTWLLEELVENGTRWNFGLYTGVGTDFRLFDLPLYAFFRFEHFSNGMKLWSQMGIEEKRLIGPETMVVGLGFRWPL
ncbi:MAG: acyloxyacyl hydrolase [Deltaproteobacteria bacterium]|nr:acyloxyacyl hydrolase [Deltaproteobacteria bacterium]